MNALGILSKIANSILVYVLCSSQVLSSGIHSGDISISSSNLPSEISQKFSLKKISNGQDINKLPEEFRKLVISMNVYDYYYAISPTKLSGGYIFEAHKAKKGYTICLRAPEPMSAVTMGLTTPIALIAVHKNATLNQVIKECKQAPL